VFDSSNFYYLYDQPTDMRKSFHILGAIVVAQMNLSLQSGAGFVFINRRKTHLKMLRWEGIPILDSEERSHAYIYHYPINSSFCKIGHYP
jgi:hypothetical protein